jgi:predicted TPR repeat methyltransferase
MLVKAKGRALYDVLEQAKPTPFMQAHADSYDLIVSADTLVYFGTLEEDASGTFRLQSHGRYAHSRSSLETVLAGAGLDTLSVEPVELRHEGSTRVAGWLALACKGR